MHPPLPGANPPPCTLAESPPPPRWTCRLTLWRHHRLPWRPSTPLYVGWNPWDGGETGRGWKTGPCDADMTYRHENQGAGCLGWYLLAHTRAYGVATPPGLDLASTFHWCLERSLACRRRCAPPPHTCHCMRVPYMLCKSMRAVLCLPAGTYDPRCPGGNVCKWAVMRYCKDDDGQRALQ
jgi:hypothetical protein